jgi:hypothetical protein
MASRFLRSARAARIHSDDDIPASPPPEVLDAIDAAFAACERLEATGRQVRFNLDEATGRLRAELTDRDGVQLQSLSGSAVLDLATGATLD